MAYDYSRVLVFKTDLSTREKVSELTPLLNNHPSIVQWNVDFEDIDNVLRVVPSEQIDADLVIRMVTDAGFECEELPD